MKELSHQLIAFMMFRFGPNALIFVISILIFVYWQQEVAGAGPMWRDVAFGAMSVAGVVGAFAFRTFLTRMKKVEDSIQAEIEKRDKQHKANLAVLVSIAQVNGIDCTKLFDV